MKPERMSKTKIKSTHARRVWDSRGRPTVEVEITLRYGAQGRAIAPAGASVGTGEAVELRDGGDAFGGFGVEAAVSAVNGEIAAALKGRDATDQDALDKLLIELDGTADKSRLGANALIATSLAAAQAAAGSQRLALWQYLRQADGETGTPVMPGKSWTRPTGSFPSSGSRVWPTKTNTCRCRSGATARRSRRGMRCPATETPRRKGEMGFSRITESASPRSSAITTWPTGVPPCK